MTAPPMTDTRAYPHDPDAERALLGQAYGSLDVLAEARGAVRAEHFYEPAHRNLWELFCHLADRGVEIDDISVANEIKASGGPYRFGGYEAVFSLQEAVASRSNVLHYAAIVRETYMRRASLGLLEEAREACYDGNAPAASTVEGIRARLGALLAQGTATAGVSVQDASDRLLEQQAAVYRGEAAPSLRTGFAELDQYIALKGGDVCVLAARPGVGKTGLALSLALGWAQEFRAAGNGKQVVFFSLEMPATQLVARLCSDVGGIPGEAFRQRAMTQDEMSDYTAAHNEVRELPIHIFDRSGLTVQAMRAQAAAHGAKHSVGVVIVDYVQLLRNEQSGLGSVERIGEASKGVKEMAKDLDVPVILLAQINREGGQRKRIQISDLKGAGSIEEDADQIVLMSRPGQADDEIDPGRVTLDVGKNRHGATGTAELYFNMQYSRFEESRL